jgi:DNA-binding response OmpR family regulator
MSTKESWNSEAPAHPAGSNKERMATRILFVDDEPSLRATLPQILAMHGYEVTSAGTVAEALSKITSHPFDVLISDLNIGEPGDGFTVVSAMRRTQHQCLTFILTGYPAFETALKAIRNQVDDYLLKPTPIPELVDTIEQKLKSAKRRPMRPSVSKRISEIIRENAARIVQRTLVAMKAEPELAALPLTDEQRVFPFDALLEELSEMLASSGPGKTFGKSMHSATMRGHIQRLQGYSIPLVIASLRVLENVVYEIIGENLLALDVSFVISDIRQLNNNLALQLQETARAYEAAEERRLVFDDSEKWAGWYCAVCCWNRPQPKSESDRLALASRIESEFAAHSCEAFAREHWKKPDSFDSARR